MVNNENIIPKTETVYELKDEYKVPSYEEFLKNYESDGNVSYDDLNGGGVGTPKGYGPIGEYWREWTNDKGEHVIGCGQIAQTFTYHFRLNIQCYNSVGGGGNEWVTSTSEALQYARRLENGVYSNVSSL